MFDIYRSEPGSFAGTVEDATLGSALADTEMRADADVDDASSSSESEEDAEE